jgi:hypothetical protein
MQHNGDVSLKNLIENILFFHLQQRHSLVKNWVDQASTLLSSYILRYVTIQHIKIIEMHLTRYHRHHRIAMKHYEHYRVVEVRSNTPV